MNKCFVTGVTGVVGSAVFKKLLLNTDDAIAVLIRGNNPVVKLHSVFSFLNLDYNQYANRIKVLNSSAEDENYRLPQPEFVQLAKSLKVIFHCAANVDLMQSLDAATKQSMDSMQNIFKILEINPDVKLEHVSTVGVNGRMTSGLTETRIDLNRPFFNTYENTKAIVETKIYELMDKGFKITIHRPSMVVGEAKTGSIIHFQIFYFLMRLISGEITFGFIPPILDRKLDTIPTDFVGEVLFLSSQNAKMDGKILHHCSGPQDSLTLEKLLVNYCEIKQRLHLSVRKPTVLPMKFFENTAAVISYLPVGEKWTTRLELVPQLLSYAQQDQIFHNQITQALQPQLVWPKPESYIEQTILFYLRKRYSLTHTGE